MPSNCFLKITAFVQLMRPPNVGIAMLSVAVAAGLSGTLQPLYHVFMAVFSAALIMAASNIINDVFDIDIDRINKPNRPLVAGTVTVSAALLLSIVFNMIAILLAATISPYMTVIAVSFMALLILYSYHFKRTVLWGNFIVSLSSGAAFIYGGLAVDRIDVVIFPAIFAFLFHFGREIIKDVEDVSGDEKFGAQTLAVKHGIKTAVRVVLIIFTILVVVTILPYILGVYNRLYMFIVVIGIYPVLVVVWYQARVNPVPSKMAAMSTLLKLDMLIGLIAIYVG